MVGTLTIFLGLVLNGFFTGLGVVTASTIFEYWIKPNIKSIHKRSRRLKKWLK